MTINIRNIISLSLSLPVIALLSACASTPASNHDNNAADQIAGVATSPFNDFNLIRSEIPPVLRTAKNEAYAAPTSNSCDVLTKEINTLDAALGADLDTPPTEDNPGLIERGRDEVGNAAIGALRSTAEGVVPFRSWVRRLSGADQHARDAAAAIAAGVVRRAYLKGIGEASGCTAPAAPRHSASQALKPAEK